MQHLRLFLLCGLTLFAAHARAELSFGLDHTELVTDLAPGAKHTMRFTVHNSGTEPLPMTAFAEDFGVNAGAPVFDQKAGPRSLAAKLTVFPGSFELKAGESREVTVTLDPGPGPFNPGSYYAAVLVQSSRLTEAEAKAAERGSRINVARRLGLYVIADCQPESKPLPPDVVMTAITRTPTGIAVRIKNPSNYVRFVTSGSLQLTAISGGKPYAIALRAFRLLPATETTIETAIPATKKPGEVNVLAVVDYGAEELLVGEQRLKF